MLDLYMYKLFFCDYIAKTGTHLTKSITYVIKCDICTAKNVPPWLKALLTLLCSSVAKGVTYVANAK